MEVVSDQQSSTDPLEVSRGVHAKDDHKHRQLYEERRLDDEVVTRENDSLVIFVQLKHISPDVLGSRVDP